MPEPASRSVAESLAARLPFYYGWVVVGCTMSAAFVRAGGAVAILTVFVTPMSESLGWSRLAFSGAVSLGGILAAISAPSIGVMVDRYGAGRILWYRRLFWASRPWACRGSVRCSGFMRSIALPA